ncbi:MAG: histidine phosphatase family protein [Rhodospirillales bacterium]
MAVGLCILLLLICPPLAASPQSANMSPEALVDAMRSGGYILFVRHAATDHSQSDKDLSDLRKCELQRNLSEMGKREAETLGRAVKDLNIKVGAVITSPYCRCVDTAQIAFGRYEIADGMRASFFTNVAETKILSGYLRHRLSLVPASGENTVLVGHTANLKDVTDVWPKPEGVVHVFKPLGEGKGFKHLGRIVPTKWQELLDRRKG